MLSFLHRRSRSAKSGGKRGRGGKGKGGKGPSRGWAAARNSGRHAFDMPVLVDMSPFAQASRASRPSRELFDPWAGLPDHDQPPAAPPPVPPRLSGLSTGHRVESPTTVGERPALPQPVSSPIAVAVTAKVFQAPHLTGQGIDVVAPPTGEGAGSQRGEGAESHSCAAVRDPGRVTASPEHMYVDFPISTKRGSTGSIVVPPLWCRSSRDSRDGRRTSQGGAFAGKRPSIHHGGGIAGGTGGGAGRRRRSSTDSLVSQLSGYYATPSSSSCTSAADLRSPLSPISPGLGLAFDRDLNFGASQLPEKLPKLAEEDTAASASSPSPFYSAAGAGAGRLFTMANVPLTPMSASLPGPGPRPRRRASSAASAGPYTLAMAPAPPRPRRRSSFVQLDTLRHNTGVSRFARLRHVAMPPCSRVVADQMLSCRGPGAFLFRESKGVVVLSVFDGASVHHLQVQTDGTAVSPAMFAGSEFRAFIRHYNDAMLGADEQHANHGLPIKLRTLVLQ